MSIVRSTAMSPVEGQPTSTLETPALGARELAHAHPLRMVAHLDPRDLLLLVIRDDRDLVVAGEGDEAVLAVSAIGGPVGHVAESRQAIGERGSGHDRGV